MLVDRQLPLFPSYSALSASNGARVSQDKLGKNTNLSVLLGAKADLEKVNRRARPFLKATARHLWNTQRTSRPALLRAQHRLVHDAPFRRH